MTLSLQELAMTALLKKHKRIPEKTERLRDAPKSVKRQAVRGIKAEGGVLRAVRHVLIRDHVLNEERIPCTLCRHKRFPSLLQPLQVEVRGSMLAGYTFAIQDRKRRKRKRSEPSRLMRFENVCETCITRAAFHVPDEWAHEWREELLDRELGLELEPERVPPQWTEIVCY